MSIVVSIPVDEICRRGSVGRADMLALRKAYYDEPVIVRADAEVLLAINRACHVQDPSWSEFMVEAITDYIVNDEEPQGYLNAANAQWIVSRLAADGALVNRSELELLINLLDKARWSPESLVGLALGTVARAAIEGVGPLRAGSGIEAGRITVADVDLMRRIMFAFGGGRRVALSRTEAEILFDIQDAVAGRPAPAAWTDLLVKSVANVALSIHGYAVPRREEALMRAPGLEAVTEASAWPGQTEPGVLHIDLSSYAEQTEEERALAELERQRNEIITGEPVTAGDASWLADRVNRSGRPNALANSLAAALRRDSLRTHPALQPLLASLEIAA
jgi:hypothetical protein